MDQQISIGIKKIKEIEFSIFPNEKVSSGLSIDFKVDSQFNTDNETFEIAISYDLIDETSKDVLLHIKVLNVFFIIDLKKYLQEDKKTLNLPDVALVTTLSLAISHTRGILAKNTAGSIFEDHYIPIVNPTDLAKQIFKIK